jgi:hypothetical protein
LDLTSTLVTKLLLVALSARVEGAEEASRNVAMQAAMFQSL